MIELSMLTGIQRQARISDDGRYRYTLMRRWGEREKGVCWIMLNPSTADAEIDDPTIRRCMSFSQRLGWDAMVVVNLFAFRATDPRDLLEADDAVGPENGSWVRKACYQSPLIIAAWGGQNEPIRGAAEEIKKILTGEGYKLYCLGKTKDGSPRHPLYVRADASLIEYA